MTHHLVGAAEVAKLLGVSRQRVDQLTSSYEDFPLPVAELSAGRIWERSEIQRWIDDHPDRPSGGRRRGSGMFERMTDAARRVIVLSQEEARLLGHTYIGTEHLLLALSQEDVEQAGPALRSFDLSLEVLREATARMIGRGRNPPEGHIPFTPRAKKVLELALREALQLGHDHIGAEHILLGLIREGQGVGAQLLQRLGVDAKQLRASMIDLMVGAPVVAVRREGDQTLRVVVHVPEGTEPDEVGRIVSDAFMEQQGSPAQHEEVEAHESLAQGIERLERKLEALLERLDEQRRAREAETPTAGEPSD